MGRSGGSLDSGGVLAIGIGAAADFFCAAKAAEGASPRTVEWYRMILIRAVRRFADPRPVDAIPAPELRAWLLEPRDPLAPESIAGYVRGLKAFGNWCAAEELASYSSAGPANIGRPRLGLWRSGSFLDGAAIEAEHRQAVTVELGVGGGP